MDTKKNLEGKKGLGIGVFIIVVLISLIILTSMYGDKNHLFPSANLIFLGIIILISYFFEYNSFIFRFIISIFGGIRGLSKNKKWAIFWGIFISIGGVLYLFV